MLKAISPMSASSFAPEIVEVKSRPNEPLSVRQFAADTTSLKVNADVLGRDFPAVRSVLPNPEYQNDLDAFRQAINATNKLHIAEHSAATERGTRRWHDFAIADDDEVVLDVTECNHIPSVIYGRKSFGSDSAATAFWEAVLESVTTVPDASGGHQFRRLARYFLYLDQHEGRLANVDLSPP